MSIRLDSLILLWKIWSFFFSAFSCWGWKLSKLADHSVERELFELWTASALDRNLSTRETGNFNSKPVKFSSPTSICSWRRVLTWQVPARLFLFQPLSDSVSVRFCIRSQPRNMYVSLVYRVADKLMLYRYVNTEFCPFEAIITQNRPISSA